MRNIKQTLAFLFVILITFQLSFANDGYLGVSVRSYTLNNQDGLRVIDVFDDGAAFVSGLLENDFITTVNNEPVSHPYDLKNIVKQLQWGDEIKLDYIRNGESYSNVINLGYKAYTRTYEIIKTNIDEDGEEWFFKDSTSINFELDEPVSMTKVKDGSETSISIADYDDYESVPQQFLDLSDKLFIIEETKRVQAERESNASNIVVFKEVISTEIPTSIINPFKYSEFKVFPNPNSGDFQVSLMSTDMKSEIFWSIYDIQGRTIDSGSEMNDNGTFNKSFSYDDLESGNYLLYIKSGDKRVSSQFIIK